MNLQISVSVCGLEEDADDRFRFFEGGSTGTEVSILFLLGHKVGEK